MLIYDDFEDEEELEQVYSIFSEKRRKRIRELLEEDEIINNVMIMNLAVIRQPSLFRKRWDSSYLLELANREKSFVAEYRLDNRSFDILHTLLDPLLEVNQNMAKFSMSINTGYYCWKIPSY